jgi:hypothetical protein
MGRASLGTDQFPPGSFTTRRGPTFYATLPADHASRADIPAGQPILLSAASFETLARYRGRPGALDVPRVPKQVPEIAVDPGGFIAASRGGYRFSWAAYEQLAQLGPRLSWAASPDLPCEQALTPLEVQVRASGADAGVGMGVVVRPRRH